MNLRRRIVNLFSQIDIIERIYPAVLCGVVRQRKSGVGNLFDVGRIVSGSHIVDTLSEIIKSLGRAVRINLICSDDRRAGQRGIFIRRVQDLCSVGVVEITFRNCGLDRGVVDIDVVLYGIRSSRSAEIGDLIDRELITGLGTLDRKSDLLGGRQSGVCSGYIRNGNCDHHNNRKQHRKYSLFH